MKRNNLFWALLLAVIAGVVIGGAAALLLHCGAAALTAVVPAAGVATATTAVMMRSSPRAPWTTPLLKNECSPLPQPINSLFLYNTLSTVHAFMELDPKKARKTVEDLAELVRTLSALNRRRRTFLGQELKAVDLFLNIEQNRLSDRLQVRRAVSPECLEISFPSLALVMPVVSLIREGVELQSQPVTVFLSCALKESQLVIELLDTLEGEPVCTDPALSREEAFRSTVRCLRSHYGAAADCRRERLSPFGERLTITVPLAAAAAVRSASDFVEPF